jgi:fructuronate reductase
MRDALAPQGGTYTALELGPDGQTARTIDSVTAVLVAREDPAAVIAAMADPAVRIVSLTVTEKGYCHNPATGALNLSHPDIAHDIDHSLPVSAPGFLVRALAARRAAGLPSFTVLCCDNLPDNGRVVRGVTLSLARAIDPALADWIEANGRFPSTMVDRIVPASTDDTIATVARLTGRHDAAPVQHEPFRQWVIEDDFVGGDRPDLAPVGVQFTHDVTPWEHMKLRMLNGTHSALAYTGYLAGHQTIADCMADPVFAAFAHRLWSREIIPALTPPPGADLTAYARALADRYANPGIRHRTWQIAMDGSQKLPQRILGTLATALDDGRHTPGLILTIAAWMRYVGGTDEQGQPIDVRDPLAARLRALCDANPAPDARVRALLGVSDIFPPALAPRLTAPVTAALTRLTDAGSRAAVADLTEVPA